MAEAFPDIKTAIEQRLRAAPAKWVWTPRDLLDLGRRCAWRCRAWPRLRRPRANLLQQPGSRLRARERSTFILPPTGNMTEDLRREFDATGMILGEVSAFGLVMETVAGIELAVNGSSSW